MVQEERTEASQGFVIAFEAYSKRADSSQGFVIAFKSYSRKTYACIDMGKTSPHEKRILQQEDLFLFHD
jgi:hypothetical protein